MWTNISLNSNTCIYSSWSRNFRERGPGNMKYMPPRSAAIFFWLQAMALLPPPPRIRHWYNHGQITKHFRFRSNPFTHGKPWANWSTKMRFKLCIRSNAVNDSAYWLSIIEQWEYLSSRDCRPIKSEQRFQSW